MIFHDTRVLQMLVSVKLYYFISLGSRPSPCVRVLIARRWANRSSARFQAFPLRARFNCAGVGKSKLGEGAWDDSSREGRTAVGQYLARAPWCGRGTLYS